METSSPPETLVNCYTHADPDIFPNIQVLLSIWYIYFQLQVQKRSVFFFPVLQNVVEK